MSLSILSLSISQLHITEPTALGKTEIEVMLYVLNKSDDCDAVGVGSVWKPKVCGAYIRAADAQAAALAHTP